MADPRPTNGRYGPRTVGCGGRPATGVGSSTISGGSTRAARKSADGDIERGGHHAGHDVEHGLHIDAWVCHDGANSCRCWHGAVRFALDVADELVGEVDQIGVDGPG